MTTGVQKRRIPDLLSRVMITGRPATVRVTKSPGLETSESWPAYIQQVLKTRFFQALRFPGRQASRGSAENRFEPDHLQYTGL